MLRVIGWAALAALLTMSIAVTALAEGPDGSSDSTAISLASGAASGIITGDSSGAYRYYAFNSPSGDNEVTVTMSFTPTEQAVANAIGVVAWQNGKQLGKMSGVGFTPGTATFAFKPSSAGKVTLQVYSYYPAVVVSFALRASVVDSAAPTGVPQPTATPGPLTAAMPGGAEQPGVVVLPGNGWGSFHYYQFDYPGNGSPRTATIQVWPNGADTTNAVFLSIYQNGVRLASRSVREVEVPGILQLKYSSDKPGPVLIEVANYNFARTITYTLTNGQ
jgi:hypothetical protein